MGKKTGVLAFSEIGTDLFWLARARTSGNLATLINITSKTEIK